MYFILDETSDCFSGASSVSISKDVDQNFEKPADDNNDNTESLESENVPGDEKYRTASQNNPPPLNSYIDLTKTPVVFAQEAPTFDFSRQLQEIINLLLEIKVDQHLLCIRVEEIEKIQETEPQLKCQVMKTSFFQFHFKA